MSDARRLLGVDYGSKRIGLSISDPDRKFAFPLTTYERCTAEQDAVYLRDLIAAESIGQIVLGLPVHLDGREGQESAEVRAFGAGLAEPTGLQVVRLRDRF